ncbi:MAG: hypothetical protein CL566_03715 [Alphaproteobacteria bacterium]|nr:hypothetical protein [Alphaproteobacteria bacterium]
MATRRVRDPQAFADEAAAARSRELLAAAAAGLGRIRAIGAETGLDQKVVRLGASDQWLKEFLGTPERIGLALDTPAPV